jgi:hypothetical protein
MEAMATPIANFLIEMQNSSALPLGGFEEED